MRRLRLGREVLVHATVGFSAVAAVAAAAQTERKGARMATRLSEGAGPGGASGGGAAHHALGFRVMRLCRPALSVEPTLRVHRDDLTPDPPVPDPTVGRGNIAHVPSADVPFANRTRLDHPADALGMAGMLVLPQSFG